LIPFSGKLLFNRLIWLAVSVSIFLFTLFRFDFQRFLMKKLGKKKGEEDSGPALKASEIKIPAVSKTYTRKHNWQQLWQLTKLELTNITRDLFFRSILLIAVLFLFLDGWFGFQTYGTPDLPMTYYMLETKDFTFVILVFVLIVFITGEVMHRERAVKYDQIYGAMPLPNWVIYGSKFLSLVALCLVLVHMILISGIANQVIKGYYEFELGKYFTDMYLITFPEYIQYVMVAFFVHAVVQKKFLGHVITIAIWLMIFGVNSLANIDYNLLFYGYRPGYTISDMNGFGHFGKSQFWFLFYWLSFGGILVILGMLFWKRGTDAGRRARLKTAQARLNTYSLSGIAVLAFAFVGSGFFNYYNVSILNKYRTGKESRKLSARYEKDYRKYLKLGQPKITDVKLNAEIYPDERYTVVKGDFEMVNKTMEAIDSLHLNFGRPGSFYRDMKNFTINGVEPTLGHNDEELGYKIYKLPQTMQPGDTFQMVMELQAGYRGFPNAGSGSNIVYNGTFFNAGVFPGFGYNPGGELSSDKYRKKYELPDRDYGQPSQDDEWGLSNLLFNDDADYATF
ncbi:MAG: peptidase M1, partial [Bacteroidota bacterium]